MRATLTLLALMLGACSLVRDFDALQGGDAGMSDAEMSEDAGTDTFPDVPLPDVFDAGPDAETTVCRDEDGDGFGDPNDCLEMPTMGYVNDDTDCDDEVATTYLGAPELCNRQDDDCDEATDEGLLFVRDGDELQPAIDEASAAGQDVCVEPGEYLGPFVVSADDLMIRGIMGPLMTTLLGDGMDRVLDVQGENVNISGFGIRGGVASQGAGVRVSGRNVNLRELLVFENESQGAADVNFGSGIYVGASAVVTLENVVVFDNLIRAGMEAAGAGIFVAGNCTMNHVSVLNNTVANVSGSVSGVGIAVGDTEAPAMLRATNVIVLGNSALNTNAGIVFGAGIHIGNATANFSNVTIAGNTVVTPRTPRGVGCFIDADGVARFINVINAFNTTRNSANGNGYFITAGGVLDLTYSDTFGNRRVDGDMDRNIDGLVGETLGSISEDPMFRNLEGDLTTLRPVSPCRNTGEPLTRNPDGMRADMGAYGGPGADWPPVLF